MKTKVQTYRLALRKDRTITVAEPSALHASHTARIAHAVLADAPQERLIAIMLSQALDVVAVVEITSGGSHSMAVDPRILFRAMLLANVSTCALAHNHPSGDPTASKEDIEFTRKARAQADILGLNIVDHVIVTRDPKRFGSVPC